MSSAEPGMQEIEQRFVAWAASDVRIRAAFVIGSRARTDHPADVWSDLDIVTISAEPEHLLNDTAWLAHLGTPLLTFVEPTAVGDGRERRVLFAGGHDVDIAIFSEDQFEHLRPEVVNAVARRGVRVLLDKDGRLTVLRTIEAASPVASPSAPDPAEWLAVCNNFWYHALWTARKLRRGELFVAKECCDRHMKDLLGQMIVWHAGATRGWSYDTWHRGRFLEEWADPRILSELKQAYAHYEGQDIERALQATMNLFGWVARETAGHLRYAYPAGAEERISALVASVLDD